MYTFTHSINYDLNQFPFWHTSTSSFRKSTTDSNHNSTKFTSLSKPSRSKVLIISYAKKNPLFLQLSKLLIYSRYYLLGLILKIPKTFQTAFRFSTDRYIRNRSISGLLERRRHDCKSFSPDLFSRSSIYIYIYTCMYTACSKLIFVSSASFLAGSFSPRACTRCWHGYKVTGEANRTSDESQLVEISSTNITRRALIALDGREAAALRREIARESNHSISLSSSPAFLSFVALSSSLCPLNFLETYWFPLNRLKSSSCALH